MPEIIPRPPEMQINIDAFADRVAQKVIEGLQPYLGKPKEKGPNDWLTIDDLARDFKCHRRTIERLIDMKDFNGFPVHKFGRQYRFKLSEVELWIRKEEFEKRKKRYAPRLVKGEGGQQ